jgi:rhamnulokinase
VVTSDPSAFAAVDLGASSGRVMVGLVGADTLSLSETFRFPNVPVEVRGTLHWDALALFNAMLEGLRAAVREAPGLTSVGIDSWAVDYGLLDSAGELLGNPVHYRDRRTEGALERTLQRVSAAELYARTGIQLLPFNTVFQLVAAAGTPAVASASQLLLIPDLLTYWLTGAIGAEVTNASTTQLLDVRTAAWDVELMERLGISPGMFPSLRQPGDLAGVLLPGVRRYLGLDRDLPVTAVASHDTASAVVGVPAGEDAFAYISCGTWSLVGVELDAPVLSEESRLANFTNEAGVDGTVRYLRNVMGLWLLQETLRTWTSAGLPADLPTLLQDAARVPRFTTLVDPDDPSFLPPGDMPARIAAYCARSGQPPPQSQAETVRCILDSLALAYRRSVRMAARLSGRSVDVVHLVGGGVRNELLCQLTADACGLPVVAGPVEAAALGNVLVQARAAGVEGLVGTGLREMRTLCRRTQTLRRYEPVADESAWAAAGARIGLI